VTTANTPVSVPGSGQTPASVPGSVQRTDDPNTPDVAADEQPTRVNRPARGSETKAFYKSTKFIVFIVATVGVLLASYLVKASCR
jgi:hypothetical protein